MNDVNDRVIQEALEKISQLKSTNPELYAEKLREYIGAVKQFNEKAREVLDLLKNKS